MSILHASRYWPYRLAKFALAAAVGAAVLGPATAASATSVAQVGNSSVIAAEGPNHSQLFYWQTIGGVPWHPEVVAGPGTTYSAPSVAQVGTSSVIAAQGTEVVHIECDAKERYSNQVHLTSLYFP